MAVLIRPRRWNDSGAVRRNPAPLIEKLKQQPGFLLHVSFEDAQGFAVAELWETKEQHDDWFDANVKPNVPAEITQEVIEVHGLHKA